MYEYYDSYERAQAASDADAQARWARQLIWEVARHAVGEEIVVYPLMEEHMGAQGKALADGDRVAHQVRCVLPAVLRAILTTVPLPARERTPLSSGIHHAILRPPRIPLHNAKYDRASPPA